LGDPCHDVGGLDAVARPAHEAIGDAELDERVRVARHEGHDGARRAREHHVAPEAVAHELHGAYATCTSEPIPSRRASGSTKRMPWRPKSRARYSNLRPRMSRSVSLNDSSSMPGR